MFLSKLLRYLNINLRVFWLRLIGNNSNFSLIIRQVSVNLTYHLLNWCIQNIQNMFDFNFHPAYYFWHLCLLYTSSLSGVKPATLSYINCESKFLRYTLKTY